MALVFAELLDRVIVFIDYFLTGCEQRLMQWMVVSSLFHALVTRCIAQFVYRINKSKIGRKDFLLFNFPTSVTQLRAEVADLEATMKEFSSVACVLA